MAKKDKETTAVDEASAVVDSTSVNEVEQVTETVEETTEEVEKETETVEETTEEVEKETETVEETTEEETVIEEVIVDSVEAVKEAEAERLTFEYKKGTYGFTADTPNSFKIFGELFTQQELLSNTELMHELIDSKCIFIKKL